MVIHLDSLVYSTETDSQNKLIPISYSKRVNAPERGIVFTAQAIKKEKKDDLIVDRFENYTGYVKKNFDTDISCVLGGLYRFKIVAGPYTREHHNFFYAIPLRTLKIDEAKKLNTIDPQTFIFLERLGEFLMGLGWNRKQKRHYRLSEEQDWKWFLKQFEVPVG
ncbi:MAG: hypothetical protein AABW67_03580 [Nanoarchaeota archaeon]